MLHIRSVMDDTLQGIISLTESPWPMAACGNPQPRAGIVSGKPLAGGWNHKPETGLLPPRAEGYAGRFAFCEHRP